MKNNRQIGLDGRIFITDCLSDGIFFIYSIILSGCFGAAGDIMKLLGRSSHGMDTLTNSLVICDLVCSLGLIIVTYYVYFMHCGENIPKLGTKPLIWLEYLRLGYYGVLAYHVLFRFAKELQSGSEVSTAIPIFYFFYFAWILCCMCAAMYILTVLHQNMIRRNYAQLFRWLSLIGLGTNALLPLVYFITRIWVKGAGDGFYSAGLCDFVRFALAPMFYAGVWFLFMSAIDQIDKVFNEVDAAIRDKRYRIEFEEDETEDIPLKSKKNKQGKKAKKSSAKKKADKPAAPTAQTAEAASSPKEEKSAVAPVSKQSKSKKNKTKAAASPVKPTSVSETADDKAPLPESADSESPDEISIESILAAANTAVSTQKPEEHSDAAVKKVKPKKKHRITAAEEASAKGKAAEKETDEPTHELSGAQDTSEEKQDG